MRFYLEHPTDERFKYALTDYAIKFIKFIDNKLYNPYIQFPLRKTFQKLADFKSEEIVEISDFLRWYEFNFEGASGQVILEHLEALKDYVNNGINELNSYLTQKSESAIKISEKVALAFEKISSKSDEIKDTLKLSNALDQEIEKVISYFFNAMHVFENLETIEDKETFLKAQKDYNTAINIKNDVEEFFVNVEYRLGQLIDRSVYASGQLNNLQENFRNKSQFRINLKRFLQFTLNETKYSKSNWVSIPNAFPIKTIVREDFKYVGLKYYEEFGSGKSYVAHITLNDDHHKKETVKISNDLKRQETISKWVQHYKQKLLKEKCLDFNEYFYELLNSEKDPAIGLNVGFELFQFARKNSEFKIEINQTEEIYKIDNKIKIWKMKIMSNLE